MTAAKAKATDRHWFFGLDGSDLAAYSPKYGLPLDQAIAASAKTINRLVLAQKEKLLIELLDKVDGETDMNEEIKERLAFIQMQIEIEKENMEQDHATN